MADRLGWRDVVRAGRGARSVTGRATVGPDELLTRLGRTYPPSAWWQRPRRRMDLADPSQGQPRRAELVLHPTRGITVTADLRFDGGSAGDQTTLVTGYLGASIGLSLWMLGWAVATVVLVVASVAVWDAGPLLLALFCAGATLFQLVATAMGTREMTGDLEAALGGPLEPV
jgi:hypothetical protein